MARVYVERRELPANLVRLLEAKSAAAECTPPMDVVETAHGIDVLLDIPGVAASDIEIIFAGNVLLIAGRKLPAACEHKDAGFHMAERAFGRFARALSVEGAFERRGNQIRIPIR